MDFALEKLSFNGLPAIRWRSRDGAAAIATLQGAHIVSWIPARGDEALFVSERSAYEAGKAIRGGIPVIFPQFADRGPMAQHGFARTQPWRLAGASESELGRSVSFSLEGSPALRALWPHDFRLMLTATLGGPRLAVELRVDNPGGESFTFTAALHTYLELAETSRARLLRLRGVRYLNRGETETGIEDREAIPAREAIDRIYFAAPAATRLEDDGRVLEIEQRGFTDTVVWNPGKERAALMADMAPDGWRRMVCVEAAAIEPPVQLDPGASWVGLQSIRVA